VLYRVEEYPEVVLIFQGDASFHHPSDKPGAGLHRRDGVDLSAFPGCSVPMRRITSGYSAAGSGEGNVKLKK